MAYFRIRGSVQRVEVYDTRVDQWWSERGPVGRLTYNVARRGGQAARRAAPVRTGNLRRSIRSWSARRGKRHRVANVGTNSRHAEFVRFGTGPQIASPENGNRIHLRGQPGAKSHGYWRPGMRSPWPRAAYGHVAGQEADDFLAPAVRAAELYIRGR